LTFASLRGSTQRILILNNLTRKEKKKFPEKSIDTQRHTHTINIAYKNNNKHKLMMIMLFIQRLQFVVAATTTAVVAISICLSSSSQQLSPSPSSFFVSSQQSPAVVAGSNNNNNNNNECDNLSIGSYYFLNINAWPTTPQTTTLVDDNVGYDGTKPPNDTSHRQRHGEIILFSFEDIPGGIDLFLTDKPWSSLINKFIEEDVVGEGILKLTTPVPNGIPSGVPFGLGFNDLLGNYNYDWIDYKVNGTNPNTNKNANTNDDTNYYYFDLGDDGDQIFLYCIDSNGNDRPITGISYNGPFITTTPTATASTNFLYYGTNTSSAPDYLLNSTNNGTLVMPSSDNNNDNVNDIYLNWQYIVQKTDLDFLELQESIQDINNNWIGMNTDGTSSAAAASSSSLSSMSVVKIMIYFMIMILIMLVMSIMIMMI
jgi:hypothetical protein